MADNVQTEAVVTAGATFATDDIVGVHWPYAKLAYGDDNTATRVSDANPLPTKTTQPWSSSNLNPGQVAVGTTAVQLPNAAGTEVHIRSVPTNDGVVCLGVAGVTGVTGYLIWPGDMMPPLHITNLNLVYAISLSGTQTLCYLVLS